ncbi:pentapeptide repeat-containing protein [Gilvimarinus japonicus]|uniref:Pentapeptide repeat-containing protein n=1 Tax=Gilvimarinus japonicus TaxID=1796469 RepID=A0ABV7HQJ6_9GAMM
MKIIIKSPVATLATIAAVLVLAVFLITAFWSDVSSTVLPNTKLGLYNKDFWENFLVELHGIVFELSIIGVLLLWLDSKRTKSGEIKRLREDLEDYSTLDYPEINVKKLGHMKRLNEHKIKNIDVQNLVLNELKVKGIIAEDSRLIGLKIVAGSVVSSNFKSMRMRSSNFHESTIKSTIFESCDLLKSKFNESICKGVDFTNSSLERADFTNSDLQSSIFNGCDVRGAKFDGANLKHVSFHNSKHLTSELLLRAKNLDYVKVSDEIMAELIAQRPDMKYQKNKGRP